MKTQIRFFNLFLAFCLVLGGLAFTPVKPAYAATLAVTNTNNSGVGSLRYVLAGASDGDIIDATGISGMITLASELYVDKNITIKGSGAGSLTINGSNVGRVFNIWTVTVVIENLTIANGQVTDSHGAGIYNLGYLTLNNVIVTGNDALSTGSHVVGGGIYNDGSLTMNGGEVTNNSAHDQGGGIYSVTNSILLLDGVLVSGNHVNDVGSNGGGVYVQSGSNFKVNDTAIVNNSAKTSGGGVYSEASLTMENSLVVGNTAVDEDGGGLLLLGVGNTVALTNVTVSGNSAGVGGGGILVSQTALNLNNVTITDNTSSDDGGGIVAGTMITNMKNSIIAGNTATNDLWGGEDCRGQINSQDYNLVQVDTCLFIAAHDITGISPLLNPLADNGGFTQTHSLGVGSPAMNAGNTATCAAADQRGIARPQGTKCDIGAFETEMHSLTLRSVGANDGWALESGENTAVGGTMDSTATTFRLGDDAQDKQYRAILDFNTAGLPDTAVITKVTLKIKQSGAPVGSNPFTILNTLKVDIRKPRFGNSAALANSDFQAAASQSAIGTIPNTPVSNWYTKIWASGAFFSYVNKTGATQFRLYFAKGDNDNNAADYMKFISGDYATASVRPTLIIEYYVP